MSKVYKAKNSWKRVIPFWVCDEVGKDNYKELQRGNTAKLSNDLKKGVYEYLVEAPKVTVKKKNLKKGAK